MKKIIQTTAIFVLLSAVAQAQLVSLLPHGTRQSIPTPETAARCQPGRTGSRTPGRAGFRTLEGRTQRPLTIRRYRKLEATR